MKSMYMFEVGEEENIFVKNVEYVVRNLVC